MRKVLIANDDAMQLMCLSLLFKGQGYEVHTSDNGHQAFEGIKQTLNNEKEMFDLVVLDLNMPILNGWAACKKIQEMFDHKNKLFTLQFVNTSAQHMLNLKPVVVGVTGSTVTCDMTKEALESGFQNLY